MVVANRTYLHLLGSYKRSPYYTLVHTTQLSLLGIIDFLDCPEIPHFLTAFTQVLTDQTTV